MFWRFAFQSNSNSLDNLIDKYLNNLQQKNNNPSFNPTTQSSTPSQQNNNNVELSTILLEEEFLPQLKKGSEKLIELLINPQVLSKLFSIILREPQTSPNFISNTQSKERSSEDSTSSANSNLEDNNLKSEKLYNIALEVLSIDNDSITTSILADPNQSLMKLWEILSQKPSIDPALSTSFARVFGGLLTRKTKETLEFIFNQKNALNCILTHFENPIIMDLLLKLICLEEIPEGMGVVDWLHKEGLIKKLVDRLAPSALPNTHSETSQVILHIVAISQCTSADQFSIGINPLIEELVSEEVVKTIVNYMLKPCSENIDSCLTFGVTIFIEIIRRNYIEGEFEIPPPSSRYHGQRIPANLGNLVKILTENLENFLNLLKNPRKVNKVKNSSGEFIPLGFERLKVCELIAELLHCSNMLQLSKIECPLVDQELESFLKLRDDNLPTQKVNDESAKDKAEEKTETPKVENTQYQSSYFDQFNDSLISSSTSLTAASKEALNNSMEKLSISNDSGVNSNFLSLGNWTKLKFLELNISSIFLDLFFQYELNNFLHVVVFDLIHQLLNLTLDNKVNICLLRDLFIDCKLIARIIDAQKVNDDFINTRGGYRLGYMGHLTFIAEETVKHLERIDLELGFEVKDIKTSKEWEDYSKLSLKETKQRDLEPLDGNFSASSTVLDKDLPKLPSPTTNNITTTTNNNVKKTFKTNSPPEFSKNDDINKQQLAKFLSQPESLNQVHGGIIEDGVDWDEEEDEEDDQQNSDQDLNFIKVDKRSIVESNNSGDDSDIDKGDESDDKLLPLSAPSSTKVINGVESDNLNHSSNSSTSKKYRRFSLGSIDPSLAESLSSEFLVSSPTAQFFGSQNIPIKALPTTQTNNELAKMEFYPTQKEAISNKMKSQTLPPIRKHVRRRSISSIIVPSLKSLKDQAKSGDWQSIFKLREYDEGYPSASGEPNCPSFTSAPPPAPKPDRKSKREDFLNGIKMHSRSNSTYF